ncbi:amino acid/amide ABC transporter substrate-binding protein, HAAT family [Bradyrhizobium sp. Rc2d]|uniref:ABC transporter substrate-binding protein n=1 Tax=Bradyrhizobium sp. Rc2d TaxID=1855321 RepID=UPI000889CE0D|nr:ABC transporter substrate-binding protein [Bradyrhizobium sp. Rc2d]SDJ53810.1 amino acid/amide ABC transporter substrate-binding protein, HAAT family [Bradyrhizobium sp. Rc2d]
MYRNTLTALAIIAALVFPGIADAQTTIKIGVLTDMSGLYSDFSGAGSVEAAKMAAEDFMAANPDVKVEVVSADHQNKPDIAASIARKWFENDGIHAIADVATSSASLAVAHIAKDKNKVFLATNAATTDLTGKQCTPNTVHWTFDTWGFAHGTGEYLVEQGKKRWFFLTADYVYGHTVERETSDVVKAAGGTVVGSVRHPLNTPDFSSFLLQAQASKAEIIALANAGGDTINTIKQAAEFGIAGGRQELAAMAIFLSDVHSLGLETAQGLKLTTWFYWDLNDTTRAFAKRFAARRGGQYPSMGQAGTYAASLLYLKAMKKAGSATDGANVVATMRGFGEYDDPLFGRTQVRTDGRATHPIYLAEVKKPSESKGPYDYYKILATIPPEQSARSLAESRAAGCELTK